MNNTQATVIQNVLDCIENDCLHRARYKITKFTTQTMPGRKICVQVDTRYGDKGHFLLDEAYQFFVGPRGGITQYDRSARAIVSRKYAFSVKPL